MEDTHDATCAPDQERVLRTFDDIVGWFTHEGGCRPRALCSSPVGKLRTCSSTTFGCVHPDRFLRLLKPAQPELLVGDFWAFGSALRGAGQRVFGEGSVGVSLIK